MDAVYCMTERNEKGEGFLRDIIERAHDEIGYQINGENIAMQITPLKDKGRGAGSTYLPNPTILLFCSGQIDPAQPAHCPVRDQTFAMLLQILSRIPFR
mgnify:CR=1 FL=1